MTGQELINIIKEAGAENLEVFVSAEYKNGNEFANTSLFSLSLFSERGIVKGYNYDEEKWTTFEAEKPERLVINIGHRFDK